MTPLTGISTTLPDDVVLDSGVLYINATTPFGVSKGAWRFDPAEEWGTVDFDGKTFSRVQGLDRKLGGSPKISGTLVELSATRMDELLPGSSQSGTTDITVTPKAAGDLLATGSYTTNVRVVFRRGNGKFAIVVFPIALCTKFGIEGQDRNSAGIPVEFEAVQSVTDAQTGAAPWKVILADAVGGP